MELLTLPRSRTRAGNATGGTRRRAADRRGCDGHSGLEVVRRDWAVERRLQVGELLDRFGFRGERRRPDYPVAALFNAGLWELETGGGPIPTAHGDAELRRWFDNHAPRADSLPPHMTSSVTLQRSGW
jgi:hypothetical protein